MKESFSRGGRVAFEATGGSSTMGTIGGGGDSAATASAGTQEPPGWARRMKRSQQLNHRVMATAHAIRAGDSHGGGSSVNLSPRDQ
jgi:type IV secretion system protein TrbL